MTSPYDDDYKTELAERDSLRDVLILAARENFYTFVQLMAPVIIPGFIDGIHIKVIAEALQEAFETDDARLMIFLPPGAMKSKLGSELFPAWCFGREPTWQILHIGHSADFTAQFGGNIRDLMSTDEYREIFPEARLNDKYQAREYWKTTQSGIYRAAGAGSAIAGKRGNIGICGLDTNFVLGSNGTPIRLRDLKAGQSILGPNGTEVVTKRVDRRHKVCYTINGQVEVSPEHPFLNYSSKQWVEAKDLLVGKTKLVVGDSLWTRIVKKCTKFGVVLKGAVVSSAMAKMPKNLLGILKRK